MDKWVKSFSSIIYSEEQIDIGKMQTHQLYYWYNNLKTKKHLFLKF